MPKAIYVTSTLRDAIAAGARGPCLQTVADFERAVRNRKRAPIHISGRRWFQRSAGNTYHSVRIYRGGECIADLGPTYGYGDHYLQTAIDWLRANGYPSAEYGTRYLREVLGATYDCADVAREKDL